MSKKISSTTLRLWLLLLLIQVMIHLPFMNRVAMGNHVWRQCNTLAVAKNYYEQDMNILYPRIDKNYGTNGITGPQFTSYDYSLALLYQVFGFSETLHRWFSLCISLCAILGMLFLVHHYFPQQQIAFWSGLALIGIPEFYYYSIAALPDLLALAAMLWGWYVFYRYLDSAKLSNALIAGLLLALAGMTKLMFLVPGFVFLGEILKRKAWGIQLIWGYMLIGGLALGGSIIWYWWAKYLTSINGIEEFVHAIRFKESWGEVLRVLGKNLSVDLMETWVGYPLLLPFLLGLILLVRKFGHDPRIYLSLFAALLYYIFMQHQLEHHGYYMVLFLPFIVLILAALLAKKDELTKQLPQWTRLPWQYLFLLAPIWAFLRIQHNFNTEPANIPQAFVNQSSRNVLQQMSQKKDLWIVGPDQSGCVHFYFLGAKGFPWYNLGDSSSEFSKFKSMGAKGIITQNEKAALEYCKREKIETRVDRLEDWTWLIFK